MTRLRARLAIGAARVMESGVYEGGGDLMATVTAHRAHFVGLYAVVGMEYEEARDANDRERIRELRAVGDEQLGWGQLNYDPPRTITVKLRLPSRKASQSRAPGRPRLHG